MGDHHRSHVVEVELKITLFSVFKTIGFNFSSFSAAVNLICKVWKVSPSKGATFFPAMEK